MTTKSARPTVTSGGAGIKSVGETNASVARLESAGVVLRAAEALADPQALWTTDQVVYLVALAFESGLRGRLEADLAELHTQWMTNSQRAQTGQERKAALLAYYEACAEKIAAQMGRPAGYAYGGGPVDWETGRPVRHLQAVAA
jgi:hypothetical protein